MKYNDVVSNMVDLQSLANAPANGEKTFESSSYNKLSKYNYETGVYENWSQNWDEGYDAPRSEDGGYVIAEMQGPGAIVRIWSAQPKEGHIKIFIDGNIIPVIDMPFMSLFGTSDAPFNLENLCYDAAGGKNCYVPITYNKSCKIVLYDDWGKFYQVNYISFTEDTTVEPFTLPLSSDKIAALEAVNDCFGGDMSSISELYDNNSSETKTVTVPKGERVNIFNTSASGAIVGLKIKINGLDMTIGADGVAHDWKALADMCISMKWDGNDFDSVWTTLGGFFGSPTGLNPYSSLPMGVLSDGTMYSNWYMPYANGAVITIGNDGDEDYSITYTIITVPLSEDEASELLRFHAKWNRAEDPVREGNDRWPDSNFLSVTGTGRYVGTSLHVYKEIGRGDPLYNGSLDNNGFSVNYSSWWWGEGDEKFFVDGEKFPSWFGTGSEDYFGYAWGNWTFFDEAYHAQPFTNGGMWNIGNRLNNRFHIIDNIPFQSSFEAYLEKYHRDEYASWVFTSYFYLDKDSDDGYTSATLSERTEYYDYPYPAADTFYEGEELKVIGTTETRKAESQIMTSYGSMWSGDEQFIYKASAVGDYVTFYINVAESGTYKIKAAFTKAKDFGIVQHYIDGVAIGTQIDLYNASVIRTQEQTIAEVYLEAGLHVFEVRIAAKNNSSTGYLYGLDYIKLADPNETVSEPVVYEGEVLTVSDSSGKAVLLQNMTSYGSWSNNKHFLYKATAVGDFVKLEIDIAESGTYKIKAAFTKAKDFGIVQHYIDGVAIGGAIDLYNSSVIRTDEIDLGEVYLEKGVHTLEICIISKNTSSSGYFYALDYLKLELISNIATLSEEE